MCIRDRNEDTLYKDTSVDPEMAKQACERFGLDYETATLGDITPEMVDYEFAVEIIAEDGDLPLFILPEHDGYAMSLEAYVNDIHAFYGSRPIIEAVCERDGIDANTAVVKDLTVEQLSLIHI